MTVQEIMEMLTIGPEEDVSLVQAKCELAYQYTVALIKDHLGIVDTVVRYSDLGPSHYEYLPAIGFITGLSKLSNIEAHFHEDRLAVMSSFRDWKIPANTITVYPEVIIAEWNLITPIDVDNRGGNIISMAFAEMLMDAGIVGNIDVHCYYDCMKKPK